MKHLFKSTSAARACAAVSALTLLFAACSPASSKGVPSPGRTDTVTFSMQDSAFFVRALTASREQDFSLLQTDGFLLEKNFSLPQKILFFAELFAGKPYAEKTLEVNGLQEKLVVNSREVDCTTFVDQVLALVLTSEAGETTFASFCHQLTRLRYHDGKIDGYASRRHYFLDLVRAATDGGKQILLPVSDSRAVVRDVALSFMSSHPQAYQQLSQSPELARSIRDVERSIGNCRVSYFPKTDKSLFAKPTSPVRDGDIVALVTQVEGLDVSHLGIACWQDGQLHMMHASSVVGRVLLDERTLYSYLQQRKSCPGVLVYRFNAGE